MLGIVVSRADTASVHVGEHLLDLADWEETRDDDRPDAEGGGTVYRTDGARLREFEGMHLHLERPADAFEGIGLLVFVSRHAGETGPLLTAHHTGNVGPADHGGDPNELARACPAAHARVVDALATHAPEGYDVGMECTHHGPSEVGAPSMFVEVGSSEREWEDPAAARAAARAVLDLRGAAPDAQRENGTRRHLVGVGGGHYAPRFERIVRETDWAVGHVLADWGLDALGDLESDATRDVFEQAFAKSRADYALVDGDRPDAAAAVEAAGGRVVGETWVRETEEVPLELVGRVEERVGQVDEGLRFGARAAGYEGEFQTVELPGELLVEARGIDGEATRAAVAGEAVAFGTDQNGTRVTGPVVLPGDGDRGRVIEGLLDVLRERYDAVAREDGVAVARERAFDPDLARDRGVPEGPKFGALANGQPVTVDGEEVSPEEVRTERGRKFRLQI